MKKTVFIFLFSYMSIMLHAQKVPVNSRQVQTTKQLQTTMQQQPPKVTPQTRTNASQQVNNIRMFPIVNKPHFLIYTKSLTKAGMKPKTILQNRATYTNTNAKNVMDNRVTNSNSTSKNIMDNKSTKANTNTSISSRVNDHIIKIPLMYTVSRNYSDGRKAIYTLTDNTDEWAIDGAYKPDLKKIAPDLSNNPLWNCPTVTKTFTAQSTTFMDATVNQNGIYLIPGTIYAFDDYSKGNFREYTEGRNPISVWTNTTVGQQSQVIQNPSQKNNSQAISNIVRQFTPTQGGASAYEHTIFSDNQSDLNIMVSGGGSYSGFSGFAKTNQNQSQHHKYITFDAFKPLYTITVEQPVNGYFADGKVPVTSSPLIVVKNVTYGTRILANVDIQTTTNTNYDTLHLDYSDGVDNGFLNFSLLANDASIQATGNIMVVGTTINIPFVSWQNFEQQISKLLAQGNYQTAQPIEYQFGDLDGNTLGVQSITDQYSIPDCKPTNEVYYLKSVFFSLKTGADGKNDDSEFILSIGTDDGNGNGGTDAFFGFPYLGRIGQFTDEETEYKSGSTLPAKPIIIKNDPNHPNGYTLDDFKIGGYVAFYLHCADKAFKSDDWDILGGTVTFNFVSQKGTPYKGTGTTIQIPNFRLSSSTNGFTVGKETIWFDNGFTNR